MNPLGHLRMKFPAIKCLVKTDTFTTLVHYITIDTYYVFFILCIY